MNPSPMTLERLSHPLAVSELVGPRASKRWRRANPLVRRADGISIHQWFIGMTAEKRIRLVREAMIEAVPWSTLLRIEIPKGSGKTDKRRIDMPTVLDAARLYLLHDWLHDHAETVLTRVAVAFRQGRSFSDTVLGVHRRMATLPFAMVVDIRAFYDSVAWERVDVVIASLPAAAEVQTLLRHLVRVDVVERTSGLKVLRSTGIPQGLAVSPVLANLFLATFDRFVAHAIGRVGARLWRYCDDILLLAPSLHALEHAGNVVRDRLSQLGLAVKPGTGLPHDTREHPVEWLGLSFTPEVVTVPDAVIESKTRDLQARVDAGILSLDGVEDTLTGRLTHYSRILGPDRALDVIAAMRAGLQYGAPPMGRKEGIALLRELVTER